MPTIHPKAKPAASQISRIVMLPNKDLEASIRAVKNNENNAEAYYAVARATRDFGIQIQSYDEKTLLEKAAQLNHIAACLDLGGLLGQKRNDPAALKKSAFYYKKAHDAGNLEGMFNYASCLGTGSGVDKNTLEAEKILELILKKFKDLSKEKRQEKKIFTCYLYTLIALTNMHTSGIHSHSSIDKAILYLSEIAQTGNMSADYNLASLMRQTSDKPSCSPEKRNKLKKFYFDKLKALAEKRYTEAEFDLGIIFLYGKDAGDITEDELKPDIELGMKFLWRAALGGHARAFIVLAKHYKVQGKTDIAISLCKRASDLGADEGKFIHALYTYHSETSTQAQKNEAISQLRVLAEKGMDNAQYEYAEIRRKQYQENKDPRCKADIIHFLELAAQQHHFCSLALAAQLRIFHFNKKEDFRESLAVAEKYLQEVKQILQTTKEASILALRPLITRQLLDLENAKTHGVPKSDEPEEIKPVKKKKKKTRQALITLPIHRGSTHAAHAIIKEVNQKDAEIKAAELLPVPEKNTEKTLQQPRKRKPKKSRQVTKPSVVIKNETVNATAAAAALEIHKPVVFIQKTALANSTVSEIIILPPDIVENLKKLESQGYSAYVVGGTVRNILCGIARIQDDIDIVTDAPVNEIERIFSVTRNVYRPELCRFCLSGRYFDIVHDATITESPLPNAMKRDFTINALYANSSGEVFDPARRGLADLANSANQLQTLTQASFTEDPLRILRYIYFRACGFTGLYSQQIALSYLHLLKTQFSTQHNTLEVAVTFKEKFDQMICKFFMSGNAFASFNELLVHGFFVTFFPELQMDNNTLSWFNWRLGCIDMMTGDPQLKHFITRNHIYGVLLVAMLNSGYEEFYHNRDRLLENYAFPANLRWNRDFLQQVELLQNEKMIFPYMPREFQAEGMTANFRTFEDIVLDKLDMRHPHPDQDRENKFTDLSLNGYQNSGHFRQQQEAAPAPAPAVANSAVSLNY